jgi:hypothetical protein
MRNDSPVRLYSEAGWEIPALKRIISRTPVSQGNTDIGGTAVQHKTFSLSPSARRPVRAYRVLFLSHKDNVDYVNWHEIEPRSVSVYSHRNRMFAVIVEGVIRLPADPGSGHGGTGGEVRIAYQDVDGSGKFKLLLENLPFDFRPELPSWANK